MTRAEIEKMARERFGNYATGDHEKAQRRGDFIAGATAVLERVKGLEDALEGLMQAHRSVFGSSLFTAFQAGKTQFLTAWTRAEDALKAWRGGK